MISMFCCTASFSVSFLFFSHVKSLDGIGLAETTQNAVWSGEMCPCHFISAEWREMPNRLIFIPDINLALFLNQAYCQAYWPMTYSIQQKLPQFCLILLFLCLKLCNSLQARKKYAKEIFYRKTIEYFCQILQSLHPVT